MRLQLASRPHHSARKGAILLVVLTMLALFAVIGLSFVLYAESEAHAARIGKEAVSAGDKLPDSTETINSLCAQILFSQDVPGSALYGHDMARHVYGYTGNTSAYNGIGVYREPLDLPMFNLGTLTAPAVPSGMLPIDRTQVVRFGRYNYNPLQVNEFVTVLPDQVYGNGYVDRNVASFARPGQTPDQPFFVPRNSPYSYPDRKNIYMGIIDAHTGQVVKPSYHQPELFTTTFPSGSVDHLGWGNPNWYVPQGYFKILRPRPIDNLSNAEITYLQSQGLWPIPPTLTNAQRGQLVNIFTGNDANATAQGLFTKTFPFPPMNADGTVTGDVQNWKYADGRQRNDSMWLDIGMQPKLFKGKLLKPMVAPLMVPLDGRVNYNVAGNLSGTGSASSSNQGFGPWEVNLQRVLIGDSRSQHLVEHRNGGVGSQTPNPRDSSNTTTGQITNPNTAFQMDQTQPHLGGRRWAVTIPPRHSQVDWDGNGAAALGASTTSFSSSYTFDSATYGNSIGERNPFLYNPYQWNPMTISGGASLATGQSQYPLADVRWLNARYSEKPGNAAQQTHLGLMEPNIPLAQLSISPAYPTAPQNAVRAMLTPVSNRLMRPGMAPSHLGNVVDPTAISRALIYQNRNLVYAQTNAMAATPDPWRFKLDVNVPMMAPVPPLTVSVPQGTPYQPPPQAVIGGDIASKFLGTATQNSEFNAANFRALFESVDVNRPLADYRDEETRPRLLTGPNEGTPDYTRMWLTVPSNMTPTSIANATRDRQALARDIFQRLCVATGARVHVSPLFGLFLPQPTGPNTYELRDTPSPVPTNPPGLVQHTWPVTQREYDAIRYLAQFAVNIVDMIDPDDVSTGFVWNPDPTGMADPYAAVPGGLSERTVFGVEKSKMLINEVLAEVANAQADYTQNRADQDFEVRFFIEFVNPLLNQNTKQTPITVMAPEEPFDALDPETVTDPPPMVMMASVYQNDERNHAFGNLGATPLRRGMDSIYRVRVYENSNAIRDELVGGAYNPGNVTGNVTPAPLLDVSMMGNATLANNELLGPNNGRRSSTINSTNNAYNRRHGFFVMGPELDPAITETTPTAYAPKTSDATQLDAYMLKKPSGGMGIDKLSYTTPRRRDNQIVPQTLNPLNNNGGHAIVLQRLANPYLPPSPQNPYITVDFFPGVQVRDAIRVSAPNNMGMGMGMGNRTPPVDPATNASQVRRNPHAAQLVTNMVVPTNPPAMAAPQRIAFFRHNNQDAAPSPAVPAPLNLAMDPIVLHPFAEPNHFDRKLINPLEALHVTNGPSHDLTTFFATPPAMMGGPTFYANEMTNALGTAPQLMRALEVLRVKPWTQGVPHGGRVAGGININVIWDNLHDRTTNTSRSKVFEALMDPTAANNFTNADLVTKWQAIQKSRRPDWDDQPDPMNPTNYPRLEPGFGPTVDEIDVNPSTDPMNPIQTGRDRPFKGFGVSLFGGGLNTLTDGGIPTGMGIQDTLFRSSAAGPSIFAVSSTNPYLALEPLRKVYNNISTTSDTYLLMFTIGFFEIDEPTYNNNGRVVLRREAFNTTPGDLRSQYSAVIDRSSLAVPMVVPPAPPATMMDPNPIGPPDGNPSPNGSTGVPWFTELVVPPTNLNNNPPNPLTSPTDYYLRFRASGIDGNGNILVHYEGETVRIGVGTQLRLGNGPGSEVVTVFELGAAVVPPPPPPPLPPPTTAPPPVNMPAFESSSGLATIRLRYSNPKRLVPLPRQVGDPITGGIIPGNPGRIAEFNINDARFQGVLKYIGRLRP
ncbi:MAG: hypothetical protein ACRC8S_19975 [Fimbriiglobus sp.]